MKKKPKVKSNAQLKKILWPIFSQFIRKRDCGICFTCDRRIEANAYQAGHFIPRGAGGLALYFHEDNVHGQCSYCNLTLQGNSYEYGKRLGEEKVKELYKIKQQITKDYPFTEKIRYYQDKIKELDERNNGN